MAGQTQSLASSHTAIDAVVHRLRSRWFPHGHRRPCAAPAFPDVHQGARDVPIHPEEAVILDHMGEFLSSWVHQTHRTHLFWGSTSCVLGMVNPQLRHKPWQSRGAPGRAIGGHFEVKLCQQCRQSGKCGRLVVSVVAPPGLCWFNYCNGVSRIKQSSLQ